MAIITKQRKTYSVIYSQTYEDGTQKQIHETYYDYHSALNRKMQIESTHCTDKMDLDINMKLSDYLIQYTNVIGLNLWSTTRYQSGIAMIQNYIVPIIKNMTIAQIDDNFYPKFMQKLDKIPAIGKRNQVASKFISDNTKKCINWMMKGAFDYLMQDNLISENPFLQEVKGLTKRNKSSEDWTIDFVETFFRECDEAILYVFMNLLFGCGLEIGEILALTWNDIHINDNTNETYLSYIHTDKILKRLNKNTINQIDESLIIHRFKNYGSTYTNTQAILLKKEVSRTVELPLNIARLLLDWKNFQHELNKPCEVDLIFTQFNGRYYDDRTMSKGYHRIMSKTNLPKLTIVKLRNFGIKTDPDSNQTYSSLYYGNDDIVLKIPSIKKNESQRIQKASTIAINEVFNEFLPKKDENQNISQLAELLKSNPELKKQFISKLRAEI